MKHIRLVVVLTLMCSSAFPFYFGLDQIPLKAKDLVGCINLAARLDNPAWQGFLQGSKQGLLAASIGVTGWYTTHYVAKKMRLAKDSGTTIKLQDSKKQSA